MLPKTGKEARAAGVARYFTGKACKRGHVAERYACGGHCVACDNERLKPQDQRAKAIAAYYERHKAKCHAAVSAWKKKTGKNYLYTKMYRATNPGYAASQNKKREAAKAKRMPGWLNAAELFEMECIYRYCGALRSVGLDYEVDHIVPLQGKMVSGMHVPWNLQVLTATENSAKGNRHGEL